MATQLTLLCCSATASARVGAFPHSDEPLDSGGLEKARRRSIAPRPARIVRSPARAAEETITAMGLAAQVDHRLADRGFGRWEGRSLAAIHADQAEALEAWIAQPARGTLSGETLAQVRLRLRPWLASVEQEGRPVLAITHAWVMRAVLAETLALSDTSATRFDIAPLSAVRLSFHRGWRMQALDDR